MHCHLTGPGPLRAVALLLICFILAGCRDSHPGPMAREDPSAAAPPAILFQDVARTVGIDFVHFDPATPEHLIAETLGTGIAWIDYDGDGWMDLFCVQAGPLPGRGPTGSPTHRLFRNIGNGRFQNVTEQAGLDRSMFAMGVAVGDFDNDGFDDLVITHLGGVTLFHNEPNGQGGRRFFDVTEHAGLAGTNPHFATSAAWGDLDRDGYLDLYVCNYVELDLVDPLICRNPDKKLYYTCPPSAYPVVTHRLYRNQGNGTFQNVSESSGVAGVKPGAGLAVAIVDLDGDGKDDIYVANDLYPAYLFHNQTEPGGPITLVERAGISGCGLGPNGEWMSGMCVAVADVEGQGRPSLFVTNFQDQPNVLFLNQGNLRFRDMSASTGLALTSRQRLGFGAAFLDANHDGFMDLVVANGHVYRSAQAMFNTHYAQPTQVFLGQENMRFKDVSDSAGEVITNAQVGRGVAVGDYDNDGRPDVAMTSVGGPVVLAQNVTATSHDWLGLNLIGDGVKSNRNAIGTVVRVTTGERTQTQYVIGGASYLSASDQRLIFGLGSGVREVDAIQVRWPSGRVEAFGRRTTGRYWNLNEGNGDTPPVP